MFIKSYVGILIQFHVDEKKITEKKSLFPT